MLCWAAVYKAHMVKASAFLSLLLVLAACAPHPPAPPPPPPPPPAVGEVMPRPAEDAAFVRRYAREHGFRYNKREFGLGLLVLFAERAKRESLPGYSMIWGDKGRFFVNMKPPFDRAKVVALASPELRTRMEIRTVRFTEPETRQIIDRLGAAFTPASANWDISYNYRTDQFDIGVEREQIERIRALVPADLVPVVEIHEGGVTLV